MTPVSNETHTPFHIDPEVVRSVCDDSQTAADAFNDGAREIGGPWWAELEPKERWRLIRMYQAGRDTFRSQSPEPSSSEMRSGWRVVSYPDDLVGYYFAEGPGDLRIRTNDQALLKRILSTLSPTVPQPGTGEEVEWTEPPLTCPHIDAAIASGELSAEVAQELATIRGINSQLRYGTWALKARLSDYQALKAERDEMTRAANDYAHQAAKAVLELQAYLAATASAGEVTGEEVEVVATAWRYLGSRHVDFQFEPDALSIERGQLTDIEPLVRLSDCQALKAELEASQASHAAARKNFVTMQGAANELRIRAEAAEARLSAVEGAGVERIMSWLCDDVLPAYGIDGSIARNDPEVAESAREALNSIKGASHEQG